VTTTQTARSDRSVIAYLAFLGVLLATGIDIALPAYDAIEEGLNPSRNVSLVITLYVVGMAVGQLIYGPIADRLAPGLSHAAGDIFATKTAASAFCPTY